MRGEFRIGVRPAILRFVGNSYGSNWLLIANHRIEGLTPLVASELPYHQTEGQMWEEVCKTLTDLGFLEAKCTHVAVTTSGSEPDARKIYGGVYELQEDYRRAIEKITAM